MNSYDDKVEKSDLPQAPYRAIRTRFVGPTNTRGSRIIADAGDAASRVVFSIDHSLNSEQNHAYAAVLVTRKMGWTGEFYTPLVGGGYNGGGGHNDAYFWVFQPRAEAQS